jgi:sugar (pentulose or hexulose) kinase
MGVPVEGVLAVGGGARSRLWNQIVADVSGREVVVPRQIDAASLGAMLLAAASTGQITDPQSAALAMNPATSRFRPSPDTAATYQNLCARYNQLYEALRPVFAKLTAPAREPGT